MVHTPVHASWLNQIEIYFSIIQRKVVSPNDFTDLDEVIPPPARIRRALQPDRPPVQMEVHHHRPRPTCSTGSTTTTPQANDPAQPRAA